MEVDKTVTIQITLEEDEAENLHRDLQRAPQGTLQSSTKKLQEFLGTVLYGDET